MRAPEVYRGLGCIHRSDVWAFAVTLFCWIKPGVLGAFGNKYVMSNESWCIAKLMKLFPGWTGPPIDEEVNQLMFNLGITLAKEPDPENLEEMVVKVSSLDDEMRTMEIQPELKDFLRRLFIVDPDARPSAVEALESKEYSALERALRTQEPQRCTPL